jgi:predicted acylesterase/phospholipase RssA
MVSNQPFYLGLTMAGAVSAGAYTAGVMDFLIEALETWERQRGKAGIPSHRVIVPVIGGASAGGMTGIITASLINNPLEPVRTAPTTLLADQARNKLYHSWVDLTDPDMFPLMLKDDDIQKGKITSLLNGRFIDQVANRAIQSDPRLWMERPYFERHLKVFCTLSNLEGFRFNVGFRSGIRSSDYHLSRHSDYAAFVLNKTEEEYANDGWIPLDFRQDVNTSIARDAAMATGAFPVGLPSRYLKRDSAQVNDLSWHSDISKINPLPGGAYSTLNVDGGLINNEPFNKVRDVLSGITGQHAPKDYHHFDRFQSTVLMIDPFPSELEKFTPNDSMFGAAGSTLAAMIGHLRTKPADIEQALHPQMAGQFLIAPSRIRQNRLGKVEKVEGSKAIACGSLGGFGGFLDKTFRIHDYFLGRANCEWFLREHLTVPATTTNPIFRSGYDGVEDVRPYLSNKGELPIIPVLTPKREQPYLPTFANGSDWPVLEREAIRRLKKPMKQRVGKIIMNLAEYNGLERFLIGIGNRVILRGKVTNSVLSTIEKALHNHELL